jgi:cytochrome b
VKQSRRIEVWDLPVRFFHWAIVVLVVVSFVTAKLDDKLWPSFLPGQMQCHLLSGATILALVLFRIVWGVVGGGHASFRRFLYGPVAGFVYVRDWLRRPDHPERRHYLGHNPVGGWMVFVLLALLLAQATAGLFATDDILFDGPLRKYVSEETSKTITAWHHRAQWAFYLLVGLHVLAVIAYMVLRRENLVGPMFTGRKSLTDGARAVDEGAGRRASLMLAIVILAVTAAAVTALVKYA